MEIEVAGEEARRCKVRRYRRAYSYAVVYEADLRRYHRQIRLTHEQLPRSLWKFPRACLRWMGAGWAQAYA